MNRKIKVMLVDDNKLDLFVHIELVEQMDIAHTILDYQFATEALKYLKENDVSKWPDIILLDIYMPDINGHEVARRLRRLRTTKDIPILIISASDNPKDKSLSLDAGCNGYIAKPINIDCISSQIAAFL